MVDIKTYAKDMTPIKLLQMAINTFADAEITHDVISRKVHMMGFQGAKRYNRYRSLEDRKLRVKLQHYVIDIFGMDLEADWKGKDISFNDYKGYLEYYLDTEVEVYAMLNKIHNELVLNGYNAEACIIKDYLPSVVKEIEKVRRWTLDAENSDWDYTLIKIFDDKLHDKMKDVEE